MTHINMRLTRHHKRPSWRLQLAGVGALLTFVVTLMSCQHPAEISSIEEPQLPQPQPITSHNLTDYGDPNLTRLAQRLRDPLARIHIVQLGDSHTAADFFTGTLREKFQARYGNAGIGWVLPSIIAGQRSASMVFTEHPKQWSFLTSRKDTVPYFPLGGFVISPLKRPSALTMREPVPTANQYDMRVLYQTKVPATILVRSGGNSRLNLQPALDWQFSDRVPVTFPAEITANADGLLNIGGWFITRNHPGVMLSALGINGATVAMLDKWAPQWINTLAVTAPDMVILAYGTNEAFNDTLNLDRYRQRLAANIRNIRQQMPEAVILLVGPGDVIKNNTATDCRSMQPANLHHVIAIQQSIAQRERLLYWDWQQFMGGDCAIRSWVLRDLARPDQVHLTVAGYKRSANALFDALESLLSLQ